MKETTTCLKRILFNINNAIHLFLTNILTAQGAPCKMNPSPGIEISQL